MGTILIDLSKAFDLIDYNLLIAYGVMVSKLFDGQIAESGSGWSEIAMV